MTLPLGDIETIRGQINATITLVYWQIFQEQGLEDREIPIGLVVSRDGSVLDCSVAPVVGDDLRVSLCGTITGMVFPSLTQGGAGTVNAVWDGTVPEVVPVEPYDWNTHMCEAAPPPYDPIDVDPNRAWKGGPKR